MMNLNAMMPCRPVRYGSLAAGALVSMYGEPKWDTLFSPPIQKGVHWALAGSAPEIVTRVQRPGGGLLSLDTDLLCAAALGYVGAMAVPVTQWAVGGFRGGLAGVQGGWGFR